MKFSIITPCYNSEKYLEECIKSIMSQKYKDFEHIIVDGGSTDGTLDILKKYERLYNMRWISEKDDGMYDAINKGMRMANGDVLSWINSDDVYHPWTLFSVNKIMSLNSDVKWLVGISSNIDKNGVLYFRSKLKNRMYSRLFISKGYHHIRGMGAIQQESSFWKKDLWEKAGGLDSTFKYAGDFDLWRRFAKLDTLYSVDVVLASFRIHNGQKSMDTIAYCKEFKEYCTWGLFCVWLLFKLLPFTQNLYYVFNRKKLLSIVDKEDVKSRSHELINYIQYLCKKTK